MQWRVHLDIDTFSLQTHHVYSTLKRRGNHRFYIVSTLNTRGVFLLAHCWFLIFKLGSYQWSLLGISGNHSLTNSLLPFNLSFMSHSNRFPEWVKNHDFILIDVTWIIFSATEFVILCICYFFVILEKLLFVMLNLLILIAFTEVLKIY